MGSYTKSKNWHPHPPSQQTLLIREQLKLLMIENHGYIPDKTYTHLGAIFGLSRQRIEQIARNVIDTKKYGSRNPDAVKRRHMRTCVVCHKEFDAGRHASMKRFCSGKCYRAYHMKHYWSSTPCLVCGKIIRRTKVLLGRSNLHFCSKHCQGVYLGKHFSGKKGSTFYPQDSNKLTTMLPPYFTVEMFAKAFHYASHSGAYRAVHDLVLQERIIRAGHWYFIAKQPKT